MNIATFMFYFFEILAALSAVALIWVRQVFYGALLMIVCLLSLAGIFVLAFAEFLAITQIMIYAGGILMVIIFGVMLTSKISGKALVVEHTQRWSGLLVGAVFFSLFLYLFYQHTFPVPTESDKLTQQSLQHIGTGIMTDYILPFELAGILLLAALIGAAVLAGTLKPKSKDVSH